MAQVLESGHGQISESGCSAPLLHDQSRRMKKDECPSGAGSKEGTWPLRTYCNDTRIARQPIRTCNRVRGRRCQSSVPSGPAQGSVRPHLQTAAALNSDVRQRPRRHAPRAVLPDPGDLRQSSTQRKSVRRRVTVTVSQTRAAPCEGCIARGTTAPPPAGAAAAVAAGPAPKIRSPASVVPAAARWGRKGGGEERFTNTLEARLPVRRRRRRGAQAPCGFCCAGGAAAAAPAGDAAAMAAGAAPNIRRRISSRFHGQRDAGGAPALPPAPAGRAAPGE